MFDANEAGASVGVAAVEHYGAQIGGAQMSCADFDRCGLDLVGGEGGRPNRGHFRAEQSQVGLLRIVVLDAAMHRTRKKSRCGGDPAGYGVKSSIGNHRTRGRR